MSEQIFTVVWSYDTAADSPEDAARIAAGVIATGNDPAAESAGNALSEVMDESGNAVGDFEVPVPSWTWRRPDSGSAVVSLLVAFPALVILAYIIGAVIGIARVTS